MKPVNLASRPFRNQRPRILLLACVNFIFVCVTVFHVILALRLHSRETTSLRRELAELERRIGALRAESHSLERQRPTEDTVAEWEFLQELVDARTFDWVDLFARLGEGLPAGTRLVTIAPSVEDNAVALELHAVARSPEAMFETIRMLETRPEFQDVYMENANTNDEGVTSRLELTYRPPISSLRAASRRIKKKGRS